MPSFAVALSGTDTTDGTVYGLGNFSLTDKKTYLLAVGAASAVSPGVPTLSGAGEDFTQIATVANPGGVNSTMTLFEKRQSGSSTAAASATFPSQSSICIWYLIEITDGDLAAQSATATAGPVTSVTATLGALRGVNSDVVAFGMHHFNEGHTPGTGLSEIQDSASGFSFNANAMTGGNITALNVQWASAGRGGIVGVEIPGLRSMVSSQTWTLSMGSLLSKARSMVASMTWTFSLGSILDRIRSLDINPESPVTQTLTAASPDSSGLVLTAESNQSSGLTLDPHDPDTTLTL